MKSVSFPIFVFLYLTSMLQCRSVPPSAAVAASGRAGEGDGGDGGGGGKDVFLGL
jgi:hypothetical protein